MKKVITLLLILSFSTISKATIHEILVWDGYKQFLPNNLTIELGDTIQWLPLDPPTMVHTITSTNIPAGAIAFDEIWQAPADTFFQYIPNVVGLYEYECTPHAPLMSANFEVTDSTSNIYEISNNILIAHPNPTKDFINFNIDGYNGPIELEIYDLQGRFLETTNSRTVSLKSYSKGIYVFRVSYADKLEEIKILKE